MKSFEERLATESIEWVGEGLITSDQRERLVVRHAPAPHGNTRFLAILGAVGGVLLVVGISLVIKSNWEQLGDWVKIGGLVALLVGAYAAGWRLKLNPGAYPKTGDACFLVAGVLFLLGIALVSQIFHLDSRPPNGVLLWWLGIAAVPWIVRSRAMQVLSLAALLIWLMMEFAAADSWVRLYDGGAWDHGTAWLGHASALLVCGVTLVASGWALRRREQPFAGLHEMAGVLLVTAALYAIGFSWNVHHWSVYAVQRVRVPAALLLGGLTLAGLALAAWRSRTFPALGWPLLVALVPAGAILAGVDLHDSAWLWGGIACIALFVLNIAMVREGVATGRESWINAGIAGIALNVVTRYFLLFGTLLEGGVFFIVTGMLVLGLGYFLERQRRRLVGAVRQEVTP